MPPRELIKALLAQNRGEDAWRVCSSLLAEDPLDTDLLVLATHILDKLNRLPEAYAMARLAAVQGPDYAACWVNLGRLADRLYLWPEAEVAFRAAVERATDATQKAIGLQNFAGALVNRARWQEAEQAATQALAIDSGLRNARGNLGMAQLAQGKWTPGWQNYDALVGSESRQTVRYGPEREWDGSVGKVVAIASEQGLGDVISFASMVPDAIRDCRRVIFECDAKLEGLFRRSFPQARVYGTRGHRELSWSPADREPEASCLVGQLGKFYRRRDMDFDGAPYLKPCPVRTKQWKAHFAGIGKPVIGVAWTGGVQWTAAQFRHWKLDDLLPVFLAADAHWVSLQYKDASAEIDDFRSRTGIEVHQYPWSTLTPDYDDTAALVAACDQVISMQTAVIHLAGALGVPTWVFVNAGSQWRYGIDGESMPWYRSVRLFRQKTWREWVPAIESAATALREMHHGRVRTEGMDRVRPERNGGGGNARAQHPAKSEPVGTDRLCQSAAIADIAPPQA